MDQETESFREWIGRPQVLVGLSALVLSLCGLFISIYETRIVREEQRASVWPHVEVGTSVNAERVRFHVRNTGVGPARIRAAAVLHRGDTLSGWEEMLRRVADGPLGLTGRSFSLINGAVLPPNAPREEIFELTTDDVSSPEGLVDELRQAVLDGDVDVTTCYCSVYDECWKADLQELLARHRGERSSLPETGRVESCEGAAVSGI